MIVADASTITYALADDGESRRAMRRDVVAVPQAADLEVAAALRRQLARRRLTQKQAQEAVTTWMKFGCERYSVTGLLPRIWELRDNVTPYDAAYVALAEALDCRLLTSDVRLAQATGPRCTFAITRN